MRTHVLRFSQTAIDLLVLAMAFTIAFLLRFDWRPPGDMIGRLTLTLPYIVLGEYLVLWIAGVPRFSWRFIGLREIGRILVASVIAAVILLWIRIGLGELQGQYPVLRHGVVPIGVLAMNLVLMFLGIGGIRVVRRLIGERVDTQKHASGAADRQLVPTMLVGAGAAGLLVTKEIAARPELGVKLVGFLDDDRDKVGTMVNGVAVLGRTDDLPKLCAQHGAKQVLITMASAPGATVRRISKLAETAGLPVKIIPGLWEIVGGKVNLSIRPVAIEDLLRREPVALDLDAIAAHMRGRVVLVTGAGGSIGSEICRQVMTFDPAALVLVERAENALFEIHRELLASHPGARIEPILADISDEARIRALFDARKPDAVFHAAAHKHVPMMEWNAEEAIANNVFGTKIVADAAREHGASTFVLISTDKAVNPSSVMGASKRVAEMYVQSLRGSGTRFVTVRFGNVLGSTGSVVPIFREQIARGGPVTVTHPEMTRYFMTIPEACQLVLQAGTMGEGGEIFVLDMGEPVKIVDLARDLIRLSGFKPDEEIEIQFAGIRPGEKLFEELSVASEKADKTKHPKIFVGRCATADPQQVDDILHRLSQALERPARERIVAALSAAVPEYDPTPARPAPAENARPKRRQTPRPALATPRVE
jgi:FlaA1/EpsC-like NDP-sugar epimerase